MGVRMTAEARLARAKYMREWRKKNPDRTREYEARRWQRVADRETNNTKTLGVEQ